MASSKGPTTPANKIAMSRALGAAFLSHQVEQLEKTVSNGPASGNWRSRRQSQAEYHHSIGGRAANGNDHINRPSTISGSKHGRRKSIETSELELGSEHKQGRRSFDSHRIEKDADVVVVDASVLVHALYQVKKWCRAGRQEKIIVPLEALNTLDILKKGITPLAQRARAASRILEAQVGVNPRSLVQRDDAFVLWDEIEFKETDADRKDKPPGLHSHGGSPEWVRRTICCVKWEVDNAAKSDAETNRVDQAVKSTKSVVLAVSAPSQTSPLSQTVGLLDAKHESPLAPVSPVPLPAPHAHVNRNEIRSTGTIVSHWAAKAGIKMLEVPPTIANAGGLNQCDEEERGKRQSIQSRAATGGKGRRISPQGPLAAGHGGKGLVERPQSVEAMHAALLMQPTRVVRVLARGEKLDP